jgi:uncharacterized protein
LKPLRASLTALCLSLLGPVALAAVPDITAPTVDSAGVLGAADRAVIDRDLVALRDATGVQMAVLIVPSLEGVPVEDFAQQVFSRWGGGRAGRDDGVLLVLSVGDRRARLELGYGIEAAIPDAAADALLESIKPALREGDYARACGRLVAGVRQRVAHITPSDGKIDPPPRTLATTAATMKWVAFLAWLAGVVFRLGAAGSAMKRTARPSLRLLPVLGDKPRRLGVWVVMPLLMLVLFGFTSGLQSGVEYLLLWYLTVPTGLLAGWVCTEGPVRAVIFTALSLGLFGLMATVDSVEPVQHAWVHGLVLLTILGPMSVFFLVKASSSSRRRGSSSSSSWSGGGGSSGGGGASSSW